jgi:hypothetical protein
MVQELKNKGDSMTRHSKGTKVTKEEYNVIKSHFNAGEWYPTVMSHNFKRSVYTLKKIKDSKSYNDYLMMVGRQGVDLSEYRHRQEGYLDKYTPFNCSVNGYDDEDEIEKTYKHNIRSTVDDTVYSTSGHDDDEDVEWEVTSSDVRMAGLVTTVRFTHRLVKEILKRLDQIDENTKYFR